MFAATEPLAPTFIAWVLATSSVSPMPNSRVPRDPSTASPVGWKCGGRGRGCPRGSSPTKPLPPTLGGSKRAGFRAPDRPPRRTSPPHPPPVHRAEHRIARHALSSGDVFFEPRNADRHGSPEIHFGDGAAGVLGAPAHRSTGREVLGEQGGAVRLECSEPADIRGVQQAIACRRHVEQ